MSDRLEIHHKGSRPKDIDSTDFELTRLREENEKLRARSVLIPESVQKIIDDYPAVCAERDRMLEALRPFRWPASAKYEAIHGGEPDDKIIGVMLKIGDMRAARDAIEGVTEPASHKGPDENLNLRNAECLPSTVAIMKLETPKGNNNGNQ